MWDAPSQLESNCSKCFHSLTWIKPDGCIFAWWYQSISIDEFYHRMWNHAQLWGLVCARWIDSFDRNIWIKSRKNGQYNNKHIHTRSLSWLEFKHTNAFLELWWCFSCCRDTAHSHYKRFLLMYAELMTLIFYCSSLRSELLWPIFGKRDLCVLQAAAQTKSYHILQLEEQ